MACEEDPLHEPLPAGGHCGGVASMSRDLVAGRFGVTDACLTVDTPCHGWTTKIRVADLRLVGQVTVRCGMCGAHWHACAEGRDGSGGKRLVMWMSA